MINSITLDWGGSDDALVKKLRSGLYDRVIEKLRTQLDKEAVSLKDAIIAKMRENFNQQSGDMAGSVHATLATVSDKTVIVTVEAGGDAAPYLTYFERGGRGPYEIRPINKKALSFLPTSNIVTFKHFGKAYQLASAYAKVIHPAIPKRPVIDPTYAEQRDGIIERIREAVAEA